MHKRWCAINWERTIICLAVIAMGACLAGNIYGFYIMPDEYTYWAYAAYYAGYDWSETVALGPYFSYGYAFLLYPVFITFNNPVMAYRVAIWINIFILLLVYALLIKIGKSALTEENENMTVYAAVSIFFPCYFFYAQTTMAETLILLLYVVVCRLMQKYLENNSVVTLVVLIVVMMYLYIVHMRTVGVLVSALFVLLPYFGQIKNGKKHLALCIMLSGFMFICANALKDRSYHELYAGINPEFVIENDYGGQLDKIKYLFNIDGLYDFVVGLSGKVLYLGLASFGLFYFGVIRLIRNAKKKIFSLETFIIMTVVSQIGISALYLLTFREISDYTYGRYNEFVLSMPMIYGLCEVREIVRGKKYKKIALSLTLISVMQLIVTVMVVRQTIKTNAGVFQGFFITGISYLYDESNFSVAGFYTTAYLFLTALMLAVFFLIGLSNLGTRRIVMYGIVVIEMCLTLRLYQVYMKPYRVGIFRDISIAEEICRLNDNGYTVYYLDSIYPASIGIIQFLKRELPLHVIYDKQYEPVPGEKTLYIMDYEDARYEQWKQEYKHYDIYGHFAILYD